MKRWWLGAVLASVLSAVCLCIAVSPAAAGGAARPEVKSFTLGNGMLFLVVERHTTPQVACRLAIRAGSALEERGGTGIAHMLEHMMFKGTKNFGTLDVEKDRELQHRIELAYRVVLAEREKRDPDRGLIREKLDEMAELREEARGIYVPQAFSRHLGRNGAVGINAFTSKDQTQYMMSVPSDMLEQWFSMVSEQIFEPAFREFYVEKEVIQREWAYRYVNDPSGAGWLELNAAVHTAHPYRNPTIGWKSDMERFSATDAREFHRRYYHPENAVAVLVGDVTVEEAERLAGIYFGRYPSGRRAPEEVTRDPARQGPRRVVRHLEGARTPQVLIGHPGARMGTDDFYALDVMTMLLSHGRGARLRQEITRKGLAAGAWAANPDNRYGGMLMLGGTPNQPDKGNEQDDRSAYLEACRELEELLVEEAGRLKTEVVSDRELSRIRNLNRYDFLKRLRSNEDLARTLATLEVQVGWEYMDDYLERISEVRAKDVMRVARTYLREERRTTCFVIPAEGGGDEAGGAYEEVRSPGAAAAREVPPPEDMTNHSVYSTPDAWRHPLSFERSPEKIRYPGAERVSAGGASLFYLPDRELPLVDLRILVKAGAVDVPAAKNGLAELLEACLVQGGTQRYGPSELAMALDEHAVEVRISVGEEETAIEVSCVRSEWGKALELLGEILGRPRFDPQVVEAERRKIMTALARQAGDAAAVSRREMEIRHFQGHPYGRDPLAALQTLPSVTREDLEAFVEEYLVPSNATVAVSGDLDLDEAEAGVAGIMQRLGGAEARERDMRDPSPTPPVLAFIHKPGQVQSQVSLCLPGPVRSDPDYWKVNLLVSVFGGSESLLNQRLREELGLVYAAYFRQSFKWRAGWLVGYIGCKGDRTPEALLETVRLMEGVQEGLPPDELERKRLDALNSFVFNVDTPAALTEVYARYELRGEPLDTLERIQEAFMEARPDELQTLAEEYLDPGALKIFVVGDGTIPVETGDGRRVPLEKALEETAGELGLPFEVLPLR